MRTLKSTLVLCTVQFKNEWDRVLPAAAFACRATPHSTTKFSPYFLTAGQKPTLPLSREWEEPVLFKGGALWLKALWKCRKQVVEAHQENLKARIAALKDAKRVLRPGAVVAVRLTLKESSRMGKFAPVYQGQFIIEEVLAHGSSAKVRDPTTGERRIVSGMHIKLLEVPVAKARMQKLPRWLAPGIRNRS